MNQPLHLRFIRHELGDESTLQYGTQSGAVIRNDQGQLVQSTEIIWQDVPTHTKKINGDVVNENGDVIEKGRYSITGLDPAIGMKVDPETFGRTSPTSSAGLQKIIDGQPFRPAEKIYAIIDPSDRTNDPALLVTAAFDYEDRGGGVQGHLYHARYISGASRETEFFREHAIHFQHGNPEVYGYNGHTNESVLAILIHRTEYLDTIFPCDENKEGLKHLKLAKEAFEARAERLKKKD